MTQRGYSRGKRKEGQGGLSGSILLRLDGSGDSQVGKLECLSCVKGNSRGAIRLESTNFLDGQAGRLESMGSGQRHSKEAISDRRLPGSCPLRKDSSHGSQAGRLDFVSSG